MSKNKLILALAAVALGYACYCQVKTDCPSYPKPAPPVKPAPTPPTPPAPKPRPRPWGEQQAAGSAAPQEGGRVSPDGQEQIQIDLPESQRKPNISSQRLGCCVFRSTEYSGRWQHEPELYNLPERMRAAGIPGGGYPEKLDKVLAQLAPHVAYAQSTNKDWELVKALLASGRMVGVDYNGHDCHYNGTIAHMVCLAHATDNWVAVSDNNFVKADQFVWMSPTEFQRRWGGWCVWLLAPPPPPVPHPAQAFPPCECCRTCYCRSCLCSNIQQCSPDCHCHAAGAISGPVYEWKPVRDDSSQVALFLAGRQVGNYSYTWDCYRPLAEDGTWGPACEAPVLPPGVEPPTGVLTGKIAEYGHPYTVCGREVSREDIFRTVQTGKAPTDTLLPYLTVIGSAQQAAQTLADLHGPLAALTARFKVNVFTPDEWQVSEGGFAHGPDVTLYLSDATGRVLSRTDGYPGTAALERAMNGALRDADPRYDPKKDRDLSKPFQLPFDPSKVPPAYWVGGAVGLYLLTRKEKK